MLSTKTATESGTWRVPQHHLAREVEAGSRGGERKPTGTHTEDTGVPYSPEHLGRALWAGASSSRREGTRHTVHRPVAFSTLGLTKST